MKASTLSFQSAVSLGIIGIAAGIAMAASGNHAAMPAHAHLNLLGWVSLFLIGIFLPAAPSDRSGENGNRSSWHLDYRYCHSGVAAIYLGRPDLEPVAIVGSLIVFGDMLLFAYLVFRLERSVPAVVGRARAAE